MQGDFADCCAFSPAVREWPNEKGFLEPKEAKSGSWTGLFNALDARRY